jgi:hypothetical protein
MRETARAMRRDEGMGGSEAGLMMWIFLMYLEGLGF